jgi:dTDP-4-amino-4,6-dideoxygalactose transaminase
LPTSDAIPLFRPFLPPREALEGPLLDALYSGQISSGPPVERFEAAFSEFVGIPRAAAVSSGTAALHLALLCGGVRPGDDVVSTPVTAEPTNMAILHAGARPVWADVDPRNGNVTAESVAAAITPRTRAIMVVHYSGVPVPLDGIRRVAAERGVPVIEDAAHALGARYGGRPIGVHSEFVLFSLQAIKHMTTIDGGMLFCASDAADARARVLRWFGIDRTLPREEIDVTEVGYKYNLTNVPATMGLVSLGYVGAAIERHIANGRALDAALEGVGGVVPTAWEPAAEPSYWMYTVLAERRDELQRHLASRGIASGTVHGRNDRHSVFAESAAPLPGVDAFYDRYLHLPCGWWVDAEQRERIVDALEAGW